MSSIYVEPYEVRHEILARVRDLEQWMDLGLRGNEYIEVDELEPVKQRIGGFMLTKNPARWLLLRWPARAQLMHSLTAVRPYEPYGVLARTCPAERFV